MTKSEQKIFLKKLNDASNKIVKASLKGPGDFLICSPEVAEAIQNLDPAYKREMRKKKLEQINKNQNNYQEPPAPPPPKLPPPNPPKLLGDDE